MLFITFKIILGAESAEAGLAERLSSHKGDAFQMRHGKDLVCQVADTLFISF